jgi:hypothetical protein
MLANAIISCGIHRDLFDRDFAIDWNPRLRELLYLSQSTNNGDQLRAIDDILRSIMVNTDFIASYIETYKSYGLDLYTVCRPSSQ